MGDVAGRAGALLASARGWTTGQRDDATALAVGALLAVQRLGAGAVPGVQELSAILAIAGGLALRRRAPLTGYLLGSAGLMLDAATPHPLWSAPYANPAHLTPLMLHVGGAVVALSLGPWQFIGRLRSRWPGVHQAVGRVYVVAVLATGVGGLLLAPTTHTGRLAGLGFGLLALGTLASTAVAFAAVRRGQIARHREWMTRSYAFIFTGVSFRLCVFLLPGLGLSFDTAYAVGAWIGWPINLAVAEVLLRRARHQAGEDPGTTYRAWRMSSTRSLASPKTITVFSR